MTTQDIQEQIRVIRLATEKASVSKEAARAFLREIGIVVPLIEGEESSSTLNGNTVNKATKNNSAKK